MLLTHDCVALFPHERDVKGVGKVSDSRFEHIDWTETGKGLIASLTPPLTVAFRNFFVALVAQARRIEKTFCVLNLSHVAVDEEYMTLIGVVLLRHESIDFANQVEVTCFFNRVLAKQRLLLASGVTLSPRLLCQVLEVKNVVFTSQLKV